MRAFLLRGQRYIFVGLVALAGLGLSACSVESLSTNLSDFTNTNSDGVYQISNDAGEVEIILDPIEVWEERGAAPPQSFTVDDKDIEVRLLKSGDWQDKSWVKVGLFWHSKMKKVMMPVVVLGPPVEISRIQLVFGDSRVTPPKAKNFSFSTGKPLFGSSTASSSSFEVRREHLRKIIKEQNPKLIIETHRGNLLVNLSVTAMDENNLNKSLKYLFADFYAKMQQVLSKKRS